MCVILSIHQKEKNPKIQLALINKIISLKAYNNNGIGILAFNINNDKWFYKREMKLDIPELQKVFWNYDVLNIHLRLATSGKETRENIHFWKKGNWFLAHNGTLSGYTGSFYSESKDKCDSYLFFKELVALNYITDNGKVKYNKIKKLAEAKSFWGRFVLVNLEKKKIWYFGDFKASLLSNKVMVISTTDMDLTDFSSFYGLIFQTEKKISVATTEIDGIFCIDLKRGRGKEISDEFENSYVGYKGYTKKDNDDYYKNFSH